MPPAPVDVALELDAVVVHAPEPCERKHLEAAGIGEERPVPAHKAVQAAEPVYHALSGADMEVIGIRQYEL